MMHACFYDDKLTMSKLPTRLATSQDGWILKFSFFFFYVQEIAVVL